MILHRATGQKTEQSTTRQMLCAKLPMASVQLLFVRIQNCLLQVRRFGTLQGWGMRKRIIESKHHTLPSKRWISFFLETDIIKINFFYFLTRARSSKFLSEASWVLFNTAYLLLTMVLIKYLFEPLFPHLWNGKSGNAHHPPRTGRSQ